MYQQDYVKALPKYYVSHSTVHIQRFAYYTQCVYGTLKFIEVPHAVSKVT